jgi:hypothetical protein
VTLYADPDSPTRGFAEAIAWLWRLELVGEPGSGSVGIGTAVDGGRLGELVGAGRLAGAIALCDGGADAEGWIPARDRVEGVADVTGVGRIDDRFTVLAGESGLGSSLGALAVRRGPLLAVGAPPDGGWGRLSVAVALAAIVPFLEEILGRPLHRLPPVGVVRLDDFPGTAQHQLEHRAQRDGRQARRIGRLWRRFARENGVLNVAVAARALTDGQVVPLEEVWPRAVVALRRGAEEGAVEPICHGLLHLDPHALERGEVQFREFRDLDRAESEDRIETARRWMTEAIAEPTSFVAPAWGYGEFAQAAAARLGLPSWLPPRPGPLLGEDELHETLADGPPGLHRLDYRPLAALARLGLPPTVVTHGALLDNRRRDLRLSRDTATLARLLVRRDLFRLPAIPGIEWVGAGRYLQLLRGHVEAE